MKNINFNGSNYELIKDDFNVFNCDDFLEKVTDYFDPFDYIFGDYSYDKLRLKGYYYDNNKKASDINKIKTLDHYIKNYCSYGAKWFLLKKIN